MDGAGTTGHVIGDIAVDSFEVKQAVESLAFAGKPGRWEVGRVKVSGMFELALGENWQALLYAPVYEDFWGPILKELDSMNWPLVDVKLHVTYEYGVADQTRLEKGLGDWRTRRLTRTKPQIVMAALRDSNTSLLTISHMMIESVEYEKIPLE